MFEGEPTKTEASVIESFQTPNDAKDSNGILLIPQPTNDPEDPLNWPSWRKRIVLVQVSLISFLSLFSASLIVPTFVPLGKYLHKDLTDVAYVVSIFTAIISISPLVWNPISNVYGRRPVYIVNLIATVAFSAASAASHDYGTLLAMRALCGLLGTAALGLGPATVCDLFFAHERGRYMGVYTLSFITGGHIAPIIGGYIEKNLTWRWCFYVPAIIAAALLISFILTVPETLYSRTLDQSTKSQPGSVQKILMLRRAAPSNRLRPIDFLRPFQMLLYPSVVVPTVYYATSFGYGTILFILTSTNIFSQLYHLQPYQVGVLLGIPLTVGSVIGECCAGYLSDLVSERRAIHRGGKRIPEDRFLAIYPGAILLPLGVAIEGVCITHKTHWIGPAMGVAIASFGLQIVTTIIYAYIADCYKPQSAEIGAVLNFTRQIFSFCVGFYAIQTGQMIGFQDAWIIWACINVATFLPVIILVWKGERWRRALGTPKFHNDL
ncbi:MFS general substrate transporter [Viridothelium virens]|uniref:MFS general substrate transporter n=1 Tax=Viridothelium virens TaxID=1048519 RepID=A0A6A6GXW7_VIRVR|nr:MFS general substrate transporter [Viridothelium virens]